MLLHVTCLGFDGSRESSIYTMEANDANLAGAALTHALQLQPTRMCIGCNDEPCAEHIACSHIVMRFIEDGTHNVATLFAFAYSCPQTACRKVAEQRLREERKRIRVKCHGRVSEWCDNCRLLKPDIKRCGQCHFVGYCSTACQHAHWRVHKTQCSRAYCADEVGA